MVNLVTIRRLLMSARIVYYYMIAREVLLGSVCDGSLRLRAGYLA